MLMYSTISNMIPFLILMFFIWLLYLLLIASGCHCINSLFFFESFHGSLIFCFLGMFVCVGTEEKAFNFSCQMLIHLFSLGDWSFCLSCKLCYNSYKGQRNLILGLFFYVFLAFCLLFFFETDINSFWKCFLFG